MAALIQRSHSRHPINEHEDIGALRRAVAELARGSALPSGEAELVANELGTNLLRHAAPGGYVLYRKTTEGIEFLSVDTGPGMRPEPTPGVAVGARSSSGGLSAGLASIRRMSVRYDCYSTPAGTVQLARLGGSAEPGGERWRYGGINVPLGDSGPSGDAWAATAGEQPSAIVVDGLGHGEEAALASRRALEHFDVRSAQDPAAFLVRAHEAMRGTRGGVAGVCVINPQTGWLTFSGVGNICGVVVVGESREHFVSQPGTLGTHLAAPAVRVRRYRWAPGATLVMSSDGIRAGWTLSEYPGLIGHDPAVIAAVLHRDFTRCTDDATVLVVRDLS
ncbi:MAG: SpoIIE family protein phosphatase [Mycolicibacterium sp.]|uniref:SpoIIE family protein phosphatase n=1 Tax=Mycolicibacterium sp. TaxID=2320850 RepID=UPI003D12E4B2